MGILERLGLQQPQVTQKMVNKAMQKARDAIDELDNYATGDQVTAQAQNALNLRHGNVNGNLDTQFAAFNTIRQDAEQELKDAKKREIKELGRTPQGCQELDRRVAALGSKITKQEDKDFVKEALLARYKIDTLEGDLSSKALPKLYGVLKMVPESHVRDNDMLKNIIRVKQGPEGASLYATGADNAKGRPEKLVYLELERSGKSETVKGDTTGKTKLNEFTTTTLHEVGHAVDEKRHFMDGKAGQGAFGGWIEVGKDRVARLIATQEGFYTGWQQNYSKAALAKTLEGVLSNGKLEKTETDVYAVLATNLPTGQTLLADAGIAQAQTDYDAFTQNGWPQDISNERSAAIALCKVKPIFLKDAVESDVIKRVYDEQVSPATAVNDFLVDMAKSVQKPTDTDWQNMQTHSAIAFCRALRMVGEHKGLWDQGASAAGKYALGGKVYQEAYKGKWIAYDAGVRTRGLTQYQFRAAGEWFAEIYSHYYTAKQKNGGQKPTTHADFAWMGNDIDN